MGISDNFPAQGADDTAPCMIEKRDLSSKGISNGEPVHGLNTTAPCMAEKWDLSTMGISSTIPVQGPSNTVPSLIGKEPRVSSMGTSATCAPWPAAAAECEEWQQPQAVQCEYRQLSEAEDWQDSSSCSEVPDEVPFLSQLPVLACCSMNQLVELARSCKPVVSPVYDTSQLSRAKAPHRPRTSSCHKISKVEHQW